MPTRPKNINKIRMICDSALSLGVRSAVSPTVASAETVSNSDRKNGQPLSALRNIAPENASVSMSFDDFADHFGLRGDCEMSSVSGWVTEQLGRLPVPGDTFGFETLHVQVTQVANHHVEQIRVFTKPDTGAQSPKEEAVS